MILISDGLPFDDALRLEGKVLLKSLHVPYLCEQAIAVLKATIAEDVTLVLGLKPKTFCVPHSCTTPSLQLRGKRGGPSGPKGLRGPMGRPFGHAGPGPWLPASRRFAIL